MKIIVNNINIQIAVFCLLGLNICFAQSNIDVNVQALDLSNQIKFDLMDYETNASEIETNQSLDESQKLIDEKMGGMENSIKGAINMLRFTRINIDRNQRTILWLNILAAIDKYSVTNIPSVSISGFVYPPPGYKGKIGMNGMLPPDTNDIADYAYYVAAVKANKENAKKANFQYALQRINNWEAAPNVEQFLRSSYGSSSADKQEFDNLLNQSSLSNARKQSLKDFFEKTH